MYPRVTLLPGSHAAEYQKHTARDAYDLSEAEETRIYRRHKIVPKRTLFSQTRARPLLIKICMPVAFMPTRPRRYTVNTFAHCCWYYSKLLRVPVDENRITSRDAHPRYNFLHVPVPTNISAPFDAFGCFSFLPMAIFRLVCETFVEYGNAIFMNPLWKYVAKREADQLLTSTPRIMCFPMEMVLNRITRAM